MERSKVKVTGSTYCCLFVGVIEAYGLNKENNVKLLIYYTGRACE